MTVIQKVLKYSFLVARVILGLTFVFSGFVKAIDPMGSVYKLTEYFTSFGWGISENLNQFFSIAQSSFELTLGILLLLNVWHKIVIWVVLAFMLIMTPFTLYISIANPVTDCGCFGDVLQISNWQTFFKNLILLTFSVLLIFEKNQQYKVFGQRTSRWTITWSFIFSAGISVYSFMHLPIVDFSHYKTGKDLKALTTLAEVAVRDSFEYRFLYKKGEITNSFSLDSLPDESQGWEYVSREQILVRSGEKPQIEKLIFNDINSINVSDDIINDTSFVFLFISPKLENADLDYIDNVSIVYRFAERKGYRFVGLTSSGSEAVDEWKYENDLDLTFFTADDKLLGAMVRSNPGIIVLKNGVIIKKWAFRDIPNKIEEIKQDKQNDFRMILFLVVLYVIPLIFFYLLHTGHKFHIRYKKKKSINSNNQV